MIEAERLAPNPGISMEAALAAGQPELFAVLAQANRRLRRPAQAALYEGLSASSR